MLNLLPEQLERMLKEEKIPISTIRVICQKANLLTKANQIQVTDKTIFLEECGLKTVIINALRKKNVETEAELKSFAVTNGAKAIMSLRNIGETHYRELLEKFPWLEEY